MVGKWARRVWAEAGEGWSKKVVAPNHSLECFIVKSQSVSLIYRRAACLSTAPGTRGIYSPQPILNPHIQINPIIPITPGNLLLLLLQRLHSRPYRLQTPIERTAVHPARLGSERRTGQVRGELVRLAHAVGGQGRVGRVARRGGELGVVAARLEVDGPVETVLRFQGCQSSDQLLGREGLEGKWEGGGVVGTYTVAGQVYRI